MKVAKNFIQFVGQTSIFTECEPNWSKFANRCYFRNGSYANRDDTQRNCEKMNAKMVLIHSSAENNFIVSITSSNNYYWLGGRKERLGTITMFPSVNFIELFVNKDILLQLVTQNIYEYVPQFTHKYFANEYNSRCKIQF
ncbi:hypothetical protein B4U80_15024 [Leptotrombidium deliense]|uniref:C-type lectin domain-containing protein n=1 Tax=Leptotrombidium deliense TaxID=299467 RepID=A0A443RTD4_9ACAR|nr:hypothetical protein B4U80_15024 [Leptotrombidium deliense]